MSSGAPGAVTIELGQVIGGAYRVERRLGGGGMGSVFVARDAQGREVAVKLMRHRLRGDQVAMERFRREGELLASLRHPSIVSVHDVGTTPDGLPYIVMELIEGRTLGAQMKRGAMTPAELVPIVDAIAGGLGVLHARGVLHRDLKPANIMLVDPARYGTPVKLLDFGIVRMYWRSRLTQDGETVGTLRWMPPESLRGEADLDARVDVYGLGVVLYEALTARHPFEPTPDCLDAILAGRWPPLDGVEPAVARVVAKAMAADRTERFDTAAEVAAALGAAAGATRAAHASASGPPPPVASPSSPPVASPSSAPRPPSSPPAPISSRPPPAPAEKPARVVGLVILIGGGLAIALVAAVAVFIVLATLEEAADPPPPVPAPAPTTSPTGPTAPAPPVQPTPPAPPPAPPPGEPSTGAAATISAAQLSGHGRECGLLAACCNALAARPDLAAGELTRCEEGDFPSADDRDAEDICTGMLTVFRIAGSASNLPPECQ